ncbi:MAG: hypothetical protein ACI9G9_001523 [Psychromonas sp.]
MLFACSSAQTSKLKNDELIKKEAAKNTKKAIKTGASKVDKYIKYLVGKSVGVVANQTSQVGTVHLVDTLLGRGVNILRVFSPEHGFRGDADAGEKVVSSLDGKTGLPIVSLYGKNKKPTAEQVNDLDWIIFDIQDVGARFYTYISSLHYVMESAAEHGVKVLVLDRPNPNGSRIDGPVLNKKFTSFVGMHPVPILHGMTVGEYAKMINGEGWLEGGLKCELTVMKMQNYKHRDTYSLPIAPSPNLRSDQAIQLYPSLCLFEGTNVSVGRGTKQPFEMFGHPDFSDSLFSFTPTSGYGAKLPKHENKICYGFDLGDEEVGEEFSLNFLLKAYSLSENKDEFFENERFFNLLAGNDVLIQQIKNEMSEVEIRLSWEEGLVAYLEIRSNYLIYD